MLSFTEKIWSIFILNKKYFKFYILLHIINKYLFLFYLLLTLNPKLIRFLWSIAFVNE